MPQTLAQRVKAKYPGVYDDLPDAELEAKVKAKYPGVYDDVPTTPAAPTAAAPQAQPESESMLGGVVTGVGKGLANTAIGLGELAHKFPGVSNVVDAIYGGPQGDTYEKARQVVAPKTGAEKAGYYGEQIGEFFFPVGDAAKIGKLAKAAEVGKSALLGTAQSGSAAQGGISGGLTAVLPGGGAANRIASKLEASAEQNVARALGPTKEWAKAEAAKLAPQMLERGVGGSRPQLLARASAETERLGKAIGAEVEAAAQAGQTVSGAKFADAIAQARDTLMMTKGNASGAESKLDGMMRGLGPDRAPIPGTESVVKRLDKLDDFVRGLGPDIPIDKAQKLKMTWDRIVSKAGLYSQKTGASATDAAAAWATREGAGAMRTLIAKGNPTIDNLNREYAFWRGLRDVLKETEKRTQAQSSGLTASIFGAVGAGAGFASGDSFTDRLEKGALAGMAGRNALKLLQSPAWQTQVSAPLKMRLADALTSGSSHQIASVVRTIAQALPAQF